MNFITVNQKNKESFLIIPKSLIEDERYSNLTSDSKILYSVLLDLTKLSILNKERYSDKDGKIFVFFSIEKIQELFNISRTKAVKILNSLEEHNLVEKRKVKNSSANKLYIKKFWITQNETEPLKKRKKSLKPDYIYYDDTFYQNLIFYKFPKILLSDKYDKISIESRLLYAILLDFTNLNLATNNCIDENGRCYVKTTNKIVGELINKKSKNTVIKILKEMEQFGLIKKEFTEDFSQLIYVMEITSQIEENTLAEGGSKNGPRGVQKMDQGGSKNGLRGVQKMDQGGSKNGLRGVQKMNSINNNKNNNFTNKIISNQYQQNNPDSDNDNDFLFENFWTSFLKKIEWNTLTEIPSWAYDAESEDITLMEKKIKIKEELNSSLKDFIRGRKEIILTRQKVNYAITINEIYEKLLTLDNIDYEICESKIINSKEPIYNYGHYFLVTLINWADNKELELLREFKRGEACRN